MSKRACAVLVLALGFCVRGLEPARAFDLSAPVKAIEKILGKKTAPAAPSASAVAPRGSQEGLRRPPDGRSPQGREGRKGRPGKRRRLPPGRRAQALADSAGAESGTLDDILLTPEPYYYQNVGRRDPFVSLVDEEYLSQHEGDDLSTEEISVRGILWGENDKFALVETSTGATSILREGDHIGPYRGHPGGAGRHHGLHIGVRSGQNDATTPEPGEREQA